MTAAATVSAAADSWLLLSGLKGVAVASADGPEPAAGLCSSAQPT